VLMLSSAYQSCRNGAIGRQFGKVWKAERGLWQKGAVSAQHGTGVEGRLRPCKRGYCA
jgi:hypothetical protein